MKPGEHKGWRHWFHRNPALNLAYRIGVGAIGGIVLIAGVIMIPYPGPGWLVVFAGLAILAAVVLTERRRTIHAFTGLGRFGVAAILPWAFASSLFILSLNYTTVANVLFWQATAPMLAALLAWVFLSEGIAMRTWTAMALAAIGVVLMVGGGIEGGVVAVTLPLLMTAAFAVVIVLSRRRADTSLAPAAFLSQVVVVVVLGPFAAMSSASATDWIWLALLGGIVASGIVLMTIAAQRIPASEIALITLLQIVLGPLLVWLAYSADQRGWLR